MFMIVLEILEGSYDSHELCILLVFFYAASDINEPFSTLLS